MTVADNAPIDWKHLTDKQIIDNLEKEIKKLRERNPTDCVIISEEMYTILLKEGIL